MNPYRVIMMRILILCFAGLLVVPGASAQVSSGKLTGTVLDSDTKEPLIGVNIVVLGSTMGAVTNVEGVYTLLNVPPGNYDVSARYVGYRGQVVKDVRVVSGITKQIDFSLAPSAIEVSEVTIMAEKVFFEAKATNTVKVLDAEAISALPVRGVAQALGTQSGVVMAEGSGGAAGNPMLNVRGGRGAEVLYVVDGVVQNDIYQGTNFAQVGQDAIAQASLQVGGFEAKYGQANSGVMNITTKTGGQRYTVGAEAITSSFTDAYGYNLYNASLAGPLFPGLRGQSFFVNVESGWYADEDPNAVPLEFNSDTVFSSKTRPNNDGSVFRLTANTKHEIGGSALTFKLNYNIRDSRTYVQLYEKWNSQHNPRRTDKNLSFSSQLSMPLGSSAAMNITAGYKTTDYMTGDGIFRDQPLIQWGDTTYNKGLRNTAGSLVNGTAVTLDPVGIFYRQGRLSNGFTKMYNQALTADFQLSAQLKSHMVEAGGSFEYNTLRYYNIAPLTIARDVYGVKDATGTYSKLPKPEIQVYRDLRPFYFGYDIYGRNETSADQTEVVDTVGNRQKVGPKQPIKISAYLQDSYEIEDLVIKLGVRFDYFDSKADILRNEALPYGYGDPTLFDDADFVMADPEVYFSPRIGLAFPVTKTTKFHAQFGTFIQEPRLIDVYTTPFGLEALVTDQNLGINSGHLTSEKTTQYELGFMQVIGDNKAGLNITAFYKNTKDLNNTTSRTFQRAAGGQLLRYYQPSNADFGTIRGVAFTLDVARMSYTTLSINYTYQKAEGTGSSTNSSYVAAFRNTVGDVPKVIAPLEFDQRHTGSINIGFSTGKGELGVLQNTSLNILATFNSGRPYTPLQAQNIIVGNTNFGETRGYVNSAYGPGSFLMNLRLERVFYIGTVKLAPYLWIENLFDAIDAVSVYRSTGDPYTTGYLQTDEGKKVAAAQPNPAYYIADYTTYEHEYATVNNQNNFGIPRMIRLGLKVSFGTE